MIAWSLKQGSLETPFLTSGLAQQVTQMVTEVAPPGRCLKE